MAQPRDDHRSARAEPAGDTRAGGDVDPAGEPGLRPAAAAPGPRRWLARHVAGVTCAALGALSLGVAALLVLAGDGAITDAPDPRVTVPFLVAAVAAAIAAITRKEGVYALPAAGVVLAGCALVLGWVLIVGVIAGVTAGVIVVMSEFV